ncbi:MAG: DUF3488 and transglutaminase-like domain-containing protein [Acidobacteriota bacterium]
MKLDLRWWLCCCAGAWTATCLGLSGEVSPVVFAVPATVPLAWWASRRKPSLALAIVFQLLALVALAAFLRYGYWRLLSSAVTLTVPVQLHAAFQQPSSGFLRRLLALAALQLVALAAATSNIAFAGALVVALGLMAPAALLMALEDDGDRPRQPLVLGGAAMRRCWLGVVPMLMVGAIVFLLVPRYEAGLLHELSQDEDVVSGFDEDVSLGDAMSIRESNAVVARVKILSERFAALQWRGVALDSFDGRRWTTSQTERDLLTDRPVFDVADETRRGGRRIEQDVVLVIRDTDTLFHPEGTHRVESTAIESIERDEWGNLSFNSHPFRAVRYQVFGTLSPHDDSTLDPEQRERCLALPDLDPRVHELAQRLTVGAATDAARASRIESWLKRNGRYSTNIAALGREDPVSRFLLEGRAGHCEYFASGMAVLLRELAIPCRLVNGYQGGDRGVSAQSYVIKQKHAHSWVEAWIDGRGWMSFDPTPEAARQRGAMRIRSLRDLWEAIEIFWDERIVGYSFIRQLGGYEDLRDFAGRLSREPWLPWAPLPLLLGLVGLRLWRGRVRDDADRARRDMLAVEKLLARHGHRREPGETFGQLVARAERQRPELAELLDQALAAYHASRFGAAGYDAEAARDRRKDLASVLRNGGRR